MKAGQNETLSSGSGSSPSSTLLTSPPSKTPSNAPPVTIIEVPKDAIKVVLQTQPEPTLGLPQIMAGWAGPEHGRASCRDSVGRDVEVPVGAGSIQKKTKKKKA